MATMYSTYTAYIGSNGSSFLMVRVLVHCTYKVSKFGYGQTKWMVTMYSKYTAYISSNVSQFWTARVLVFWTYKVSTFGYGQTKWMVNMLSKYTAFISSSGSHFLTARVLVNWTWEKILWLFYLISHAIGPAQCNFLPVYRVISVNIWPPLLCCQMWG